MKQLLLNICNLVHKGILRIFPMPQKVFIAIIVVVGLTLIGCSAPRYATQLVHDVSVDTVYLSNTHYDSVYIYQNRLLDRSKDTVYVKDVSVEYRYKLLRDTIRVVKRDSIPYEVTVIETKELQRPLTFYDHLTRLTFWLGTGALLSFIFIKIKRVF